MASLPQSAPSCPFCPYTATSHSERDMYLLLQHLELTHPENGDSPFIARDASPAGKRNRSGSRASSIAGRGKHDRSRSVSPTFDEDVFLACPIKDCGEVIHSRELEDHMELHDVEHLSIDDINEAEGSGRNSPSLNHDRTRSPSFESQKRHISALQRAGEYLMVPAGEPEKRVHNKVLHLSGLKGLFMGPAPRKTRPAESGPISGSIKRLGKAELGPHAFEERMPSWLYKQLFNGARVQVINTIARDGSILPVEKVENETSNLIPVLARLCNQDRSLSKVFLCHPAVKHIFKTHKEGGFCGYRNIQMLLSFMQGTSFPGHEHFPGRTPTVIRLQDMIESAWDQGINGSARIETGGIRGTRKYIGTPEAQALFLSLGIPCEASAFNKSESKDDASDCVHDQIFQAALEYFSTGVIDPSQKVYQTGLAPIYFQHPGHSLTIVGLEIRKSGRMNLLVFDPMFKTNPAITKLIGTATRPSQPEKLLKAFRRGDEYLGKYHSFELLKLMAPSKDALTRYPLVSSTTIPNVQTA